ncbi:Carboxy-S-adenosyl-L-methionine synthase [Defluviimonas aquaemixtae]|uniref:Carboxy-S-adenosyl-L-methionine synthase n=1 Tax=Albidovulum aquaemixtae TaxID=1542388 RepID=A0A2R8B6Q0_9RHOB|nr:methyltransferase domain-containing protein [Defluviimonas aquaemixtae]SPH18232.1 Carboxy-S-adenosyl-L-methionine synthase [Defluviimonas aquaemixtae]
MKKVSENGKSRKAEGTVGQDIAALRAGWSFGGNVADTFVSHVRQSVPYYDDGHDLICYLSDFFCHSDSTCYELGVSTGELIRKLAEYNASKPDIRWVGIDVEEPMTKKARDHCKNIKNIEIETGDVLLHELGKTDFIVSYYCIQFIPPCHRQDLFDKIYESLNWGGAFVLFEKVRGPDARFQDIMISLYNDFKFRNGFSADEILNKSRSLKGVLEPFSTEGNLGLLKRAGFVDIMPIMKYVCFEGFLAIK